MDENNVFPFCDEDKREDLIQKYNSTPQQKSRNRRVEITFLAPNKL